MSAKVGTLILDAGPLINQTRDELVARAVTLVTTPAVLREIKDEEARHRLEIWKDQLAVQQPKPVSIKAVHDFAKRTGDSLVLSEQDIEIVALAYELYPEKSILRTVPVVAGAQKSTSWSAVTENKDEFSKLSKDFEDDSIVSNKSDDEWEVARPKNRRRHCPSRSKTGTNDTTSRNELGKAIDEQLVAEISNMGVSKTADSAAASANPEDDESDWSDDGWITEETLRDEIKSSEGDFAPIEKSLTVALATRDFAVQNVAMQMGLDVIDDRGLRIKQLRVYMQRCHACFQLVPLTDHKKDFCPRCGGHTLTRVTVSVKDGELHIHLKKNMQWNTRGDRYTLAKPQSLKSRRRRHPGERTELYAEDQPEFIKAKKLESRSRRRNEKISEDWIGPSTVDSAVSPFLAKREHVSNVRIGRGRYANETTK